MMSDAAVTSVVIGAVNVAAMIIGWLTLRSKLQYAAGKAEEAVVRADIVEGKIDNNTKKLDDNTRLTRVGADQAAATARAADEVVTSISTRLNGGIDEAINEAVRPVQALLVAHMQKVAEDQAGLKIKVEEAAAYTHLRNHDMLNALGVLSNKLDILIRTPPNRTNDVGDEKKTLSDGA